MSPSRKRRTVKKSTARLLNRIGLLILLVIIAAAFYKWYAKRKMHGDLKGIEVNHFRYPVRGIDVSHYTGKIEFEKLKEQGMQFAYLRATYGAFKTDNYFERNYLNAKKSDMPVGAYHYLRFEHDGLTQAQHFLRKIKNKKFELLPVLDVEDWGNNFLTNRKKVIGEIREFITEVERQTGQTVMIYTNESGYRDYIEKEFSKQPLWICSFNNPPKINANWIFWQHSHIGKMEGAEGWLDYNVFNGNEKRWRRYLKEND